MDRTGNCDLYTTTDKFTDAIRKKFLKFYGYIYRNNNVFIKKQFNIIKSNVKVNRQEETKENMQELNIKDDIKEMV